MYIEFQKTVIWFEIKLKVFERAVRLIPYQMYFYQWAFYYDAYLIYAYLITYVGKEF